MRNSVGEDWLGRPGTVRPPLGEVHHRFLGAAQIEGRTPAVHRFPDGFHVCVGIGVEKLQEKAEVHGIAFVGGRRQQQDVIRAVAKQFAQPVTQALVRLVLGTYKGVNALRAALDAARVRVGESADEILGKPGFAFSQTRTEVDLVVVSVAELGFEDSTLLADIYGRAIELGLQLCPAEVAPLLRLQYTDQPMGEFLNVAMRPVETYEGQPIALSVANAGTGPLLLGGERHPEFLLNWMAKLVFVRPARIALPSVH